MDLVDVVDTLCGIRRVGWLQRGVENAETVCQHSLLVALLAGEIAAELREAGRDVDPAYAVAAAVIHDLAEAELGHPGNGVRSAVDWEGLELDAMRRLYPHLYGLFEAYRSSKGELGTLVSFADKLATLIRACRYAKRGYDTKDLIDAFRRRLSRYPEPYPQLLERYLARYCQGVLP
ncbi:MAG: HD family hydrolase [Thermoproteus sp.]